MPAICIETRHVKAALKAMTVKTDKNDARGMAQLMRMGWFRPAVKAPVVQEIRARLSARKLLVAKLRDVESSLRGILRGFGLKVGTVSQGKFEARLRELVAGQARLERVVGPLLRARAALRAEYASLHSGVQGGEEGNEEAKVALARKLAVVMHRMGLDGTAFHWGGKPRRRPQPELHRQARGPARRSRRGDAWDRTKPQIREWPVLRDGTTRLRWARPLHLIASCGGPAPTTNRSTSPATRRHPRGRD